MFSLRGLEAIESRLGTYSCPRGVPGRVHSLRLRRWYIQNPRPWTADGTNEDAAKYDNLNPRERLRIDRREDSIRVPEGVESLGQGQRRLEPTHWSMREQRLLKKLDVTQTVLAKGRRDFYEALQTGGSHALMNALPKNPGELAFLLRRLPPNIFSEVLRLLNPKHFIERYEEFHKEVGPRMSVILGLADINRGGYWKFSKMFLEQASHIVEARMAHWTPTLGDYKYLLKCARAIGDLDAARSVWAVSAGNSEVHLDTECYNHIFATYCLDQELYNDMRRYRLRILPNNVEPRKWDMVPVALASHRIGGANGIKSAVSQLFQRMIASGVAGDAETFGYLLIAMAREGDMESAKSILMSVWEIDVEKILADGPEPAVKAYQQGSPFYPTDQLLYTIAHCYGTNNQVPNALVLVDYVSRQYSITISHTTWNELLQWAFVSARPADKYMYKGELRDDGQNTPTLPPSAVSGIWTTMISEPYNVKPTMEMYNRFIINLIHRKRFGEAQEHIRAAHDEYVVPHLRNLSHLTAKLNASTPITSPGVVNKRLDDVVFARLRVKRNHLYMRHWLRRLIKIGSYNMKRDVDWQAVNMPNIVQEWRIFLPETQTYSIATGIVAIDIKSTKKAEMRRLRRGSRTDESLAKRGVRYWAHRHLDFKRDEFGRLEGDQRVIEDAVTLESVLNQLEGTLSKKKFAHLEAKLLKDAEPVPDEMVDREEDELTGNDVPEAVRSSPFDFPAMCYNCGAESHITPQCPEERAPQKVRRANRRIISARFKEAEEKDNAAKAAAEEAESNRAKKENKEKVEDKVEWNLL